MPVRPYERSRSAGLTVRGAMLMPLCALMVHQLRYYVAFGAHAPARLARDGHGYLSSVEPFVVLVAAVGVGIFIGRLARAWQAPARSASRARSSIAVWGLCAFGLLGIYCAQELLEGCFATGHAVGLAAVVGHGGWTAAPIAAFVGAVLAAALRVAGKLIGLAAGRGARCRLAQAGPATVAGDVCDAGGSWRLDPRSGVVAGRAPPLALSLT